MLAIAYFAWKRNEEAAKVFDREQQLITWFKVDYINYIANYPNTKVLFPRLQQIPGNGYRVVEGQGQNNSWWTLEEWFTEQHPYVAHVMKHESHKMGGTDDDKQVINSVYKLRRINP